MITHQWLVVFGFLFGGLLGLWCCFWFGCVGGFGLLVVVLCLFLVGVVWCGGGFVGCVFLLLGLLWVEFLGCLFFLVVVVVVGGWECVVGFGWVVVVACGMLAGVVFVGGVVVFVCGGRLPLVLVVLVVF
ncbi:hypothetical protein RA265_27810, partial [Pseudomonas syringae pv. tagetis]|uniref:hypothetical protein n=1 Tax=Pseudomonas syringae group genomosp. 7 TaxID=251699 RepID=UPI00376F9C33